MPECVKSAAFLFADDTKVFREMRSDDDEKQLQNDLDSLQNWSNTWLLKFHPNKCKVVNIASKKTPQPIRNYHLYDDSGKEVKLQKSEGEKDIGVLVDEQLSFSKHIQQQVNKANSIMGLIRRTYTYIDETSFRYLFQALVRPHLEYAAPVWSPYKAGDIESIENVQRRATKQIPGLKHLEYPERLRKLNMPTLKYRRLRGDMIETFKILQGIYDNEVTEGLLDLDENSRTRGNDKKLKKHRCKLNIRKYYFTNRIVETWNSLPNEVINAKSVKQFEINLDKHWETQDIRYNYEADIKVNTRISRAPGNDVTEQTSHNYDEVDTVVEETSVHR